MIDKRALDAVRFAARMHGPQADVVEAVVAGMLPSIRLVPRKGTTEQLPLGGCRIGGCPDLPAGRSWPRLSDVTGTDPDLWQPDTNAPLQFILQVNLAETAPFDVAKVLPRAGLLSFFLHSDEVTSDWGGEGAYVVLSDLRGLRRAEMPEDLPAEARYRGLALVPQLEWTIPTLEDSGVPSEVITLRDATGFPNERFWDDAEALVAEAQGFLPPGRAASECHRLVGHPHLIQSFGLADGTRLLLQADSDSSSSRGGDRSGTGMFWGDAGSLYYLLTDDDLKSHRLTEEPWVMVETC